MEKIKEQWILFINKIKNDRSLQKNIALLAIVIGILASYHFIYGDIDNRKVEIESVTHKNINRGSIYSVFLEKDKLKVHEYHLDDLSEKYCKGVADYYKLLRVISLNPVIVECNTKSEVNDIVITDGIESKQAKYYDKSYIHIKDGEVVVPDNSKLTVTEIENKYCKQFHLKLRKIIEANPMKVVCGYNDSAKKSYITNGDWMFVVENYDFVIEGQNEQYLVRRDYSLVNKMTGEITISNINSEIIGVATVSKNKKFFVSQYHDWGDSVAEVDKNGHITKLHEFHGFIKTPSVRYIRASDKDNYLYVLVEETQRGPVDLILYIIDVKSKSIIYKKTLESNVSSIDNIYLHKQHESILFVYRLYRTLKTFRVFYKTKKEE